MLKFCIREFRNECEGYFGYTADKLALEIDLKAGFEPTRYEHLIAHFHKPITPERRNFLIDKVHAVGPFATSPRRRSTPLRTAPGFSLLSLTEVRELASWLRL